MMKIIQSDNYSRESVADILITENVNEHFISVLKMTIIGYQRD